MPQENRNSQPIFIAEHPKYGDEEIHDMYWFEENCVHGLDGKGYDRDFNIKATIPTLVTLIHRLTNDELAQLITQLKPNTPDAKDKQ